ncbi:MAG: hypothetical protein Q9191_002653, partial [Dirinaria sp. TL-2023a]
RRAADADASRTEAQSLHDVRPAPDPAVHEHFQPIEHLRAVLPDLHQGVDSRRSGVGGPAAVIRQDDAFHWRAVQGGQVGVFVRLDTLQHDG